MKKYFPILLSKAGEQNALRNLSPNVKDEVSPVIQVLADNIQSLENLLTQQWAFQGNEVLLDFSLFANLSRNLGAVRTFLENLYNANINVVPVVQANSPATYLTMVQALAGQFSGKVCIRTSNDSGGFNNFNADVTSVVSSLRVPQGNIILLLDLGYAQGNNFNILASLVVNIIQAIPNLNQWADIVIAAGSFPENLSALAANQVHRLPRYEWSFWNTVMGVASLRNIVKYGDYGTKYPFYSEAGFLGSCSIKYTALTDYVIYRGEVSTNHRDGNGQYITFAAALIATPDYSGRNFSWGDLRIDNFANEIMTDPKKKTGNAGTWVEISQNHHITLLHSLL